MMRPIPQHSDWRAVGEDTTSVNAARGSARVRQIDRILK